MLGITHLRHISLFTPVLQEQADFYEKIWGLDKLQEDENNVYFRGAGSENHILHLQKGEKRGLHHIAFGVVDKHAVDSAAEKLKELGIPVIQEQAIWTKREQDTGFAFSIRKADASS